MSSTNARNAPVVTDLSSLSFPAGAPTRPVLGACAPPRRPPPPNRSLRFSPFAQGAARPLLFGASALLATLLSLSACGGGETTTTGAGGGGASVNTGGEGGGILNGGGSPGQTIDENSACATSAVEGDTLPVVMLIMFDKSGSMLDDQKWFGAKAALNAFFQDPATAGLSVGLRFFPDDAPAPGCNDQACSIDACSQPLVPPAPLTAAPSSSDPQQKALQDAVASKSPSGETPMYAALGGAAKWAKENAKEGQTRTVVVLVTDGQPTTCNTEIGAIAALAQDARDTKGVLTYAIGMPGSNQSQLDQIASAGGTDKAFLAPAGSIAGKLVDALLSIQKSQIACTFDVPAPKDEGDVVDPDLVNVNYHKGDGTFITMPRVSGLGACTGGQEWYYDDPQTPKLIHLCPATCTSLQSNAAALVKILLGCQTVVK